MHRRQFISGAIGLGGSMALLNAADTAEPDSTVRRVLVMFKCHFDAGFIDTQAAVVRKYFDQHYPNAIGIANTLRNSGDERYVWTTGSWLLYEYLEQASAADRKRMEQAIARGDIAWHALPFTFQTELITGSMITGMTGFSKSLDRRFGRTTTGAKMTDVPGHSRGLIAPLASAGVTFLDIGVNSASTPPDVSPLFVWRDPAGKSLIMMYHRLEYGGVVRIPGSDLAVAVEVADDNKGPHTIPEIHAIYAELRRRFPKATIEATNLTEIAKAVRPHQGKLPVVTQEIGDTWIYGVASDPLKLARFREVVRLREQWIHRGKIRAGDAADLRFLEKFSLAAEHTWGTDTKTWLDFDHYTPDALATMLNDPKYKTVTGSWVEKRADIDAGIAALPPALRTEALAAVENLRAVVPDTTGMKPGTVLDAPHFTVEIDKATGAIIRLRSKSNGREWASPAHPLAAFSYQTLSKADYDKFLASYITVQTDWAPKDFGKPNIERFGAQSRIWRTKPVNCVWAEDSTQHRCVAHLRIGDSNQPQSAVTAWPEEMYLEVTLPKNEPVAHVTFTWIRKRANRLPEALWLSFAPDAPNTQNWLLSKVEGTVSPGDVVSGGNRHMHALSHGLRYHDEQGAFAIDTLDAPLAVLGDRSPIQFSNAQPDLSKGIHFSLFNNGWGTNYVQWFGEDMRFRFTLRT
jgi:hypothetical protein